MKNLFTLATVFLVLSFSAQAKINNQNDYIVTNGYGTSYIFTEQNIEFSVFPDGQFDFAYVGGFNGEAVCVNSNSNYVDISYNSGRDYDLYVQYDMYGAVIQIENVPIYYDAFGRITQAGSVDIRYRNRHIVRVGGLFIHYNRRGYFSYYTGYINPWNTHYVYRPWHVYYARPYYTNCIVYDYEYRTYYNPVRYSYKQHRSFYRNRGHNNSYANGRRSFYRPGSRIHNRDGRVTINKDYKPQRRNNAAVLNKRRGIATTNISKRREINKKEKTNTHSVVTNNKSVQRGRPVTTNNIVTKRKPSSTIQRGNASVTRKQITRKGTVNRSSNRKVVNKTPVTKRANSYHKKVATTTSRTSKRSVGRNTTTTRSKKTTSRRARG